MDPSLESVPKVILSNDFKNLQKPIGSSGLAKLFLQSYYNNSTLNHFNENHSESLDSSEERGDAEIKKIVEEESEKVEKVEKVEKESEKVERDTKAEKVEKDIKVETADTAEIAETAERAEDSDMLRYVMELRENRSLNEIPFVSLGSSINNALNSDATIYSNTEVAVDDIIKNYPTIPVHKLENLDIYLVAYDNFLARWIPELKFNYTDPGRVDGHINTLKNAIKLAFLDQYTLVRKAYLEVRDQVFKDLNLNLEVIDYKKMKPAHLLLEENRVKPELFNEMIDSVFADLKAKEILDIGNHRGHGYFLLWDDPTDKSLYALPTIGTFGHFLPEPGFSLVKDYGWHYFRNTEIIGFQIGHLRKILIEDEEGVWEDRKLTGPIYLEISELEYEDNSVSRIQIDEQFFQGTIYSQIE